MTPEQAAMVRDMFVMSVEQEMPTTRKVIERIPDNKKTYKPDPKSMTAHDLAWHIASTEAWFLEGVLNGKFEMPGEDTTAVPATIADILAWYDTNVGALIGKVKTLSGDDMAKEVPFFGMQLPLVAYLSIMNRHSIHHRGQLSTYLRPMGSTVPSIYGGSADEPFQG